MEKKLRLKPMLINIHCGAEDVDIIEYAWTLSIPQLKGMIKESREEGFSTEAAKLENILDTKLDC